MRPGSATCEGGSRTVCAPGEGGASTATTVPSRHSTLAAHGRAGSAVQMRPSMRVGACASRVIGEVYPREMHAHHHHGHGSHGSHGKPHGERPARLFWTKRRIAMVAVIALVAMGVFVFLTACDRAPQPKGPAPIVPRATDATAPNAPTQAQAAAAAGGVPGGETQAGGYAVSGPDDDQMMIRVGGLVMPKPVTWVWTKPSMQFRALQYAVPAQGVNAPAAELVFSVFAGTDGGPVDANLDRWANQFREGDAAAKSVRAESTVAGMRVLRIESVGAYMGMGAAAPRPGYMQLGAIIEAPGRNVFIKLVGPQATVESNRAAFEAMVAGAKAE